MVSRSIVGPCFIAGAAVCSAIAMVAIHTGRAKGAETVAANFCLPQPGLGCVSGYLFHDLDHNGQRDTGEPGLPNFQVQLIGPVFHNTFTDLTGLYQFPPVPFGPYQVVEIVQPGCVPQDPPPVGVEDVFVHPADPVVTVDFPHHCNDECSLEYEWRGGPAIEFLDQVNYWPRGDALRKMRPGDAIGLAMRARDDDYLLHRCIDCNGDSTVVKWGRFEDQLTYDWRLAGGSAGSIVQSGAIEKSTVLYKIPICGWGAGTAAVTQTATVLLDVKSEGPKGPDAPLAGARWVITMTKDCGEEPGWIRVTIATQDPEPAYDEIIPEMTNGTCMPTAPAWVVETPIVSSGISIQEAPDLCPDYLTLLYVVAFDIDVFDIACVDPDPVCPGARVMPQAIDKVQCEWSLVSGRGEFVLGTTGHVVAFRRSKSEGATVRCTITDSGTRATDPTQIDERTVSASKPVRAYVAIGDVSPPSHFAENSAAADIAEQRYQAAGYVVTRTNAGSAAGAYAALLDPCYQALWIAAHAATSPKPSATAPASTGLDMIPGNFNTFDLASRNRLAFGCDQQPYIRELVLQGCNTANPHWLDLFVCPKVIAHKHELLAGPTSGLVSSRTPSKVERKKHFPPAPHNLSAP